MNFQAFTQLADGTIHKLELVPLTTRRMARDAVLSAKAIVAEVGEAGIIDTCVKVQRKTYDHSLGKTSIWYERIAP